MCKNVGDAGAISFLLSGDMAGQMCDTLRKLATNAHYLPLATMVETAVKQKREFAQASNEFHC